MSTSAVTTPTREKILHEALRLFADRGYDGTSVRDIASAVGIRQSSLYKHYESKQDIFDHILLRMDQRYDAMTAAINAPSGDMEQVAEGYADITIERLMEITRAMFFYWTEDPFAAAFRKMITGEQFKTSRRAERYHYYLTQGPTDFITKLFALLIEKGSFRQADPRHLAVTFYGPIFLLMACFDGGMGRQQAEAQLDAHVSAFVTHYGKEQR